MENIMPIPRTTPWGVAHILTQIASGVYFIQTATHAGLAIAVERSIYLTRACLDRSDGCIAGFYFFEEDTKSVLPMYELSSLWGIFFPCASLKKTEIQLLKQLSKRHTDYILDRDINRQLSAATRARLLRRVAQAPAN
jgi:hypothetical protein